MENFKLRRFMLSALLAPLLGASLAGTAPSATQSVVYTLTNP